MGKVHVNNITVKKLDIPNILTKSYQKLLDNRQEFLFENQNAYHY